MYLDRCVVCCESDWDDYFELHEITTKDTYILKVSFQEFIAIIISYSIGHLVRPVPMSYARQYYIIHFKCFLNSTVISRT